MIHELLLALSGFPGAIFTWNKKTGLQASGERTSFCHLLVQRLLAGTGSAVDTVDCETLRRVVYTSPVLTARLEESRTPFTSPFARVNFNLTLHSLSSSHHLPLRLRLIASSLPQVSQDLPFLHPSESSVLNRICKLGTDYIRFKEFIEQHTEHVHQQVSGSRAAPCARPSGPSAVCVTEPPVRPTS